VGRRSDLRRHVDADSVDPAGFCQAVSRLQPSTHLSGYSNGGTDRPLERPQPPCDHNFAWPSGCRAGIKPRSPLRNVRRGWIRTFRIVWIRPGLYAEAQTDVVTVAYDGNATQHQGLQSEKRSSRTSAIVGESGADLSGSAGIVGRSALLNDTLFLRRLRMGVLTKADEETVSAPLIMTKLPAEKVRAKK